MPLLTWTSSRFRECSVTFVLALASYGAGFGDRVQARIIEFFPLGSVQTIPTGINASRWISGYYSDDSGNYRGFLRAPDGRFRNIDVEGATCGTYAHSINRSGVVVGNGGYHSGNFCNDHAFISAADGTITLFDVPGARSRSAISINNGGLMTGSYADSSNYVHGFLRATDGSFTSFDPPDSIETAPGGINTGV